MATPYLDRAQRNLTTAIIAYVEALKDCTPDELLEGAQIAETLTRSGD